MSFLRVEDLDIDIMVDSASVVDQSVEYFSRSVGDGLEGTTYSVKKEYKGTTPVLSMSDAIAYEGWLRGRRLYWSFNNGPGTTAATNRFTKNGDGGGLAFTGGTTSTNPWIATHNWTLSVFASNTADVSAPFGSEGDWTVNFSTTASTTTGPLGSWKTYTVTASSGVIQAFENGLSVATVRMITITPSSGSLSLSLLGKNQTGTAATALFSNVSMCPYAYNSAMIDVSKTTNAGYFLHRGHTKPPFVTLHGDFLSVGAATPVFGNGPLLAKGLVSSVPVRAAVVGSFQPARQLEVTLVQK